MSQKMNFKDMPFAICGPGRIPDSGDINLSGCIPPKDQGIPVRVLPKEDSFSMKIGGTVFDVSTHFNVDGRQSILQQFRDLILTDPHI